MVLPQKHIKVFNTTLHDTETIYAQAIALMQTKKFDTDSLIATFYIQGGRGMRDAKTKLNIKRSVKVKVSNRVF